MSIQGGGGYSKGHARSADVERPRRAAEKRQAKEADSAPAVTRPAAKDTFQTGGPRAPIHTPAQGSILPVSVTQGQRLDEVMGHPSQIKQMADAITSHARKLGSEFDGLRTEAQGVVNQLAKSGFSAEAVAQSKDSLGALRRQMAQLRGKIAADGRRLKLLKAAASKLGEAKLSDKVGTQLKKIADMEKGWGRAFLALGIAGTFGPGSQDADTQSTRVNVGGAQGSRHALGDYLAAAGPGTASSQLLVALLEEGPHAPSGKLIAEAYAEVHADVLAGRHGKSLQGLGLWRAAMG